MKVSTTWEVPERYLNLSPVGSGAFGQVIIMMIFMIITIVMIMMIVLIMMNSIIVTLNARYVQRQIRRGEARTGEM